jgi:ABC-type multidrug transport system ATPase subunit
VIIGRNPPEGGITLFHPAVSRVHAEVGQQGGTAYISDKNSTNGTYINAQRIQGAVQLQEGDNVSIGPFAFRYSGNMLTPVEFDPAIPILETSNLFVDVKNRVGGGTLRILDNVSLSISKGHFVCIVGSSGSGKSTLMNILAARTLPTSGEVRMKGVNLATNFAALKHEIAYVPQNNVLHEALTLRHALNYAARLRLPPDLKSDSRNQIVTDAAQVVDLGERLDMKIMDLSGGQKKRASLASEMLSSPDVLFLDEVTSGLDEATDREIMALMRKRADDGMTIVCVTHTLANVQNFCDTLIIMGRGGIPTYIGPPRGALDFFGVETLGEIFDRLDEFGPEKWREHAYQKLPAMQKGAEQGSQSQPVTGKLPVTTRRPSILRQWGILTQRNTRLTLGDTKNLIMALLQSFMIGGMLGYAYSDFGGAGIEISSRIALLMALGTSALWLGTTTASTNIVGEALIFQRERDVNVSTIAFVLSKFVVSGIFTVLQVSLVFMLASGLAQEMPGDFVRQWGFMALGALIGVAMGLLISAFSNTQEQANTIVPLALIPQLILAGVLVPALPELGVWFSKATISAFWMTEGMTDTYIQYTYPIPEVINASTGMPEPLEAESAGLAVCMLLLHLGGCLTAAIGLAIYRFTKR